MLFAYMYRNTAYNYIFVWKIGPRKNSIIYGYLEKGLGSVKAQVYIELQNGKTVRCVCVVNIIQIYRRWVYTKEWTMTFEYIKECVAMENSYIYKITRANKKLFRVNAEEELNSYICMRSRVLQCCWWWYSLSLVRGARLNICCQHSTYNYVNLILLDASALPKHKVARRFCFGLWFVTTKWGYNHAFICEKVYKHINIFGQKWCSSPVSL